MTRKQEEHLYNLAQTYNRVTNMPTERLTRDSNDEAVFYIGHYYFVVSQYLGAQLQQVETNGGGCLWVSQYMPYRKAVAYMRDKIQQAEEKCNG